MFSYKQYNKLILCLFTCFLIAIRASAQFYDTGQDPSSLKWHQIRTENFQIVFPENIDSIGRQIANTLEYISIFEYKTLGNKPKKIPVILHNYTVLSNGFVVWAPKRSELFTIPSQDFESGDWLSQLVVHEYRHIVQIDNLNTGITKKITWLLGQQATAAVTGLHIPIWLLEGDAVVAETALTNSGRGRMPDFEMKLKTQLLNKGIYSYDKAIFGSYKNYVPNKYEFGYQIVAHNRIKYGPDLWANAIQNIGKDPLRLGALSYNLKKNTGLKLVKLYDTTFCELKKEWNKQYKQIDTTSYELFIKTDKKYYTNYNFPIAINNNSLICGRSSIDDVYKFVKIDFNGQEKVLLIPGFSYHNTLSYAKNLLVWDEIKLDPRWANRTYSILKTLNIKTGELKTLTSGSRYFSPSISPDGNKIVTAKVSEANQYSLVILNAENGNVLNEFILQGNLFPITPVWSQNEDKIAFIINNEKGKALVLFSLKSKNFEFLLPFSFKEISQPFFYKNYVLFNSSYSGISNIYAIDTVTKKQFQVVSAKFGTKDHFVDTLNNMLYYSNYTADGYRIVKMFLDTLKWKNITSIPEYSFKKANILSSHEIQKFYFDSIPNKDYEISRYKKGLHLFNIHSWGPYSFDLTNNTVNFPGFSLSSQNILGTAFSSLGYNFILNELSNRFYFDFLYKGFYPEIGFRGETGERALIVNDTTRVGWSQNKYIASINLPLNFNNGNSYKGLNIGLNSTYINNFNINNLPHPISGNEISFAFNLSVYHLLSYSKMDIHPHWFQQISINYEHNNSFGSSNLYNLKGNSFAIQAKFYFPGLFSHDDIMFYTSLQNKNLISFADNIILPFGYTGINTFKINSNSLKWSFPLFYPDVHLGSIFYSKRIKAALFADLAINELSGKNNYYTAIGAEITSDTYLFRLFAPFEIGYRAAYLPEKDSFYSFFVFSSGINSL